MRDILMRMEGIGLYIHAALRMHTVAVANHGRRLDGMLCPRWVGRGRDHAAFYETTWWQAAPGQDASLQGDATRRRVRRAGPAQARIQRGSTTRDVTYASLAANGRPRGLPHRPVLQRVSYCTLSSCPPRWAATGTGQYSMMPRVAARARRPLRSRTGDAVCCAVPRATARVGARRVNSTNHRAVSRQRNRAHQWVTPDHASH